MTKTEQLREKIAELEHKQWVKWSQAVADEVATSRRARWKLLWIPYSELTEEQKEQDRVWADKSLKACKEAGLAFVAKDAKLPIPKEVNDFIEGWRPLSETEKHLIMSAYNMMLKAGFKRVEEIEV